RAVAAAPAVVVPGAPSLRGLFEDVAREAAGPLGLDPAGIAERLFAREAAASTVIAPGVAVPHLVLKGRTGSFVAVLAKIEGGADFSEAAADGGAGDCGDADAPPERVRTAVFLFASEDKRGEHLRALAMVAQTIMAPSFSARWEKARTPQQLRDIFLLARRTRG
ncbi:MAG: PTS sugar transporter subunit IIA, partial [Kiritimatiellae bacterium]|nr:PTS sugar transporter subunit IIA [Kiritimatiellia bacterium]